MGELVSFKAGLDSEARLRGLAREIAMDILDLESILHDYAVSGDEWEYLREDARFQAMLREEVVAWKSAVNTKERVDLLQLSMVEQALPKMFEYLHSPQFGDTAKVTLFQALQRGAGLLVKDAQGQAAAGSKVSVTINLGTDQQIKIEHDVTPKVIDGEMIEVGSE